MPMIMPLIGVVLLAALVYYHRDDSQPLQQKIVLIGITLFIAQAAYTTIERRDRVNTTSLVVAGEGANLMLRSYMAFDFIKANLPDVFGRLKPVIGDNPTSLTDDFISQAESTLRTSLKENPNSPYLQIRLALVLAEADLKGNKLEIEKLLVNLQKNEDPRVSEFAGIIHKIYFETVTKAYEPSYEATIERLMPLSWYRDTALLRLYKVTGDSENYNKYLQLSEQKAVDWINKMALIIIGLPLVILGGLGILFIQLCLVAAKGPGEQKLVPVAGIGDARAVVTVMLAWMANEVIVSSLMASLDIKMSGVPATMMSAFLALTYLVSNGPVWFYIYWFAFRRKKIPLLSGLKIKTDKSLVASVFFGIIAWMAAVPIVLIAFVISAKFFGAHGSQNPVLSILFQVARSNNLPAIALFYLSLSVLAPLCEEPLFRGLVYQSVRSKIGVVGGAVFSAFLFAILHLDPGGLGPLFALGLVLAIVFEKTGSLVPSMICHGLWNGANFTISLLVSSW